MLKRLGIRQSVLGDHYHEFPEKRNRTRKQPRLAYKNEVSVKQLYDWARHEYLPNEVTVNEESRQMSANDLRADRFRLVRVSHGMA